MPKIKLKITKSFSFAHRGCDVVQYEAGTEVETEDQELVDTVLAEKWGSKAGEPRKTKDKGAAPENKAAGAGGDASGEEGAPAPDGAVQTPVPGAADEEELPAVLDGQAAD